MRKQQHEKAHLYGLKCLLTHIFEYCTGKIIKKVIKISRLQNCSKYQIQLNKMQFL